MDIESFRKANDLLLQMQRIEELVDVFYGEKLKILNANEEEYVEKWKMQLNGFHTSLTSKTFNIIVDSLRKHHRELEEELKKL